MPTNTDQVLIDHSSPFTGSLIEMKVGGTLKAAFNQDGEWALLYAGSLKAAISKDGDVYAFRYIIANQALTVGGGAGAQGLTIDTDGVLTSDGGLVVNQPTAFSSVPLAKFSKNGTIAFQVGGDGKVGIGTTTPAGTFDVQTGGTSRLTIATDGKLTAGALTATTDGKVGVGTATPAGTFDVQTGGSSRLTIAPDGKLTAGGLTVTTDAKVGVGTASPAGVFDVQTGGASRLTVAADGKLTAGALTATIDGKVGLGTTTPQAVLDVRGSLGGYVRVGPQGDLVVDLQGQSGPVAQFFSDPETRVFIENGAVTAHWGYFVNAVSARWLRATEDVVVNVEDFGGNLLDLQVRGVSKASVSADGVVTAAAFSSSGSTHLQGTTLLGETPVSPPVLETLRVVKSGALGDGQSLAMFQARTSNDFSSHFTLMGTHNSAPVAPAPPTPTVANVTRFVFSEADLASGAPVPFVTASIEAILDRTTDDAGVHHDGGHLALLTRDDNGGAMKYRLSFDKYGNMAIGEGFSGLGTTMQANGNISSHGNLELRRSGPPSDVVKMYVGNGETVQADGLPFATNYFFWQNRWNKEKPWWGGWNTFRNPATIPGAPTDREAYGYGFYPFRNWTKHYLIEEDGTMVVEKQVMSPRMVFRPDFPHVSLITGLPVVKSDYFLDDLGRPFIYRSDPAATATLTVAVNEAPPPGSLLNVPDPTVLITVDATGDFSIGDMVVLEGPGVKLLNVIESKQSSTQMTLKFGTRAVAAGGKVRRALELGGIQPPDPGVSGWDSVRIGRNGDDLEFSDGHGTLTLDYIRQHLHA